MIDNFDSFTYNLVQYFGQLGVEQKVFRNNGITPKDALAMNPDRVLLSPGPCSPSEAGVTLTQAFNGHTGEIADVAFRPDGQVVATAQISGTVQDASGSAVAGAEVKATQTGTGAIRTVTSGADGNYVLPSLPIGPYSLEVTKQGFSTYVQTGIELQVATSPTIGLNDT